MPDQELFRSFLTISRLRMIESLELASVISREIARGKGNIVRLRLDEHSVNIYSSSPDDGTFDEKMCIRDSAKAYSELEAKGVIYSVPGRGSFVSDNTDTLRQETLKRLADKLRALAEEIRSLGMSKGDFIGICEQAWQEAKAKERDQKDD